MYCSHLWSVYTKASISKLRVTYNNAVRKLFGLDYRCSASGMCGVRKIPSFEMLRRQYLHQFKCRLLNMENQIVSELISSLALWQDHGFFGEYNRLMYLNK